MAYTASRAPTARARQTFSPRATGAACRSLTPSEPQRRVSRYRHRHLRIPAGSGRRHRRANHQINVHRSRARGARRIRPADVRHPPSRAQPLTDIQEYRAASEKILEGLLIAEVLHWYSVLFFPGEKGFQDLCLRPPRRCNKGVRPHSCNASPSAGRSLEAMGEPSAVDSWPIWLRGS